ncbi:NAD dependent epimerase/dehydratase [Penicillium sp. IBT 18751x]|nr:NAD dependent epimerase/dehydratase [Penicillium sp. IBT 18751x]
MGQQASLPQPGTSIQVIGAGLSRTGTASFSRALEILLGGPVYHCGTQSTLGPPYQVQLWIQILRHWLSGSNTDRPTMLRLLGEQMDGYAAITDAPGSQFVPELMELYPDAKVICTIRDPISWEKSFAQVMNITGLWFLPWAVLPVPGMINYFRYLTLLGEQWRTMYGESRPTRQTYLRHIEWLKEVVPEDRLVFLDVKEGWGPLCQALGKDIPMDQPFPHVNDSEAIDRIARYHVRRGLKRWAVILAVGAVGVAFLWRR